jgi:uncharacterized protein GlcG (DUF336 family)
MTALSAEQVAALMEFAFIGARVHPGIRLAAAVVDASGDVLAAAAEMGRRRCRYWRRGTCQGGY